MRHLLDDLRTPRFVLITRDIVAAASRELVASTDWLSSREITPAQFFQKRLRDKMALYQHSLEIIENSSHPALFISYERFLRHPELGVEAFLSFVGRKPPDADPELVQKMVRYIVPERNTGAIEGGQSRNDVAKATTTTETNMPKTSDGGHFRFTPVDGDRVRVTKVEAGSDGKQTVRRIGAFASARRSVPPHIMEKLSPEERETLAATHAEFRNGK